jgi:hypothetical protein
MSRAGAMVGIVLGVMSAGAAAYPVSLAGSVCRVPRLTHLVLSVPRERAARAGCRLHLAGASIERARVQTVERQLPALAVGPVAIRRARTLSTPKYAANSV